MSEELGAVLREVSGRTRSSSSCCSAVVDPVLTGLLRLMAGGAEDFLQRNGITREYSTTNATATVVEVDGPVLFLLRPNPALCRSLAPLLRQLLSKNTKSYKVEFHVLFIPRRSFRCEQVFKEEHVLDHIASLRAVHLGFAQIERDLWTLELPEFLRECKVVGDTAAFAMVARALLDLGPIPHVRCKGHSAKDVLDLFLRMKREAKSLSPSSLGEEGEESSSDEEADSAVMPQERSELDLLGPTSPPPRAQLQGFPPIDTLIMLDRELDMISPLSTPLTYEAQLDECFSLQHGVLSLPASVLRLDEEEEDGGARPIPANELAHIELTRDDDLFHEIRGVLVTDVMRILNEKARELKDMQDQVHRTRDVEDLQGFVRRIPELQARKRLLSLHIALARRVAATCTERKFRAQWHAERELVETGEARRLLERAQDLAARGEPLAKVLRLLCLDCVLVGGFAPSVLDQIRRDLVHAYGFDTVFVLDHLDRVGLLTQRPFHPQHKFSAAALQAAAQAAQSTSSRCVFPNFPAVRAGFKLIEPAAAGGSAAATSDVSQVFAGMAPLSVRLVQMAISPGWDSKTDVLKMVGDGPTICRLASDTATPSPSNNNGTKKKNMLVLYLGGVCQAEIAALRLLSSQPGCAYNIIIGTTSVINGTTLIRSMMQQQPSPTRA